jgi:hypothetical protein
MNPAGILSPYLFNIHFNIISPLMPITLDMRRKAEDSELLANQHSSNLIYAQFLHEFLHFVIAIPKQE